MTYVWAYHKLVGTDTHVRWMDRFDGDVEFIKAIEAINPENEKQNGVFWLQEHIFEKLRFYKRMTE